ncbi:MAG: lysyl oxidase family protein [Actinomycetota bacterium]|nr:lysyl oxidase family protein [Actinomycetota bacterium]
MTRIGRTAVFLLCGIVLAGAAGAAAGPSNRRSAVLPDLRPLPPEEVLGPATRLMFTTAVDAPLVVDGCFLDERIRKGAERCLRFDAIVGNVGAGAFELAYLVDKDRGMSAFQRVFNTDGSFADRYAIRSEFHPTHAHFHVRDFYLARLWRADADGARLGEAPVARGDKSGFCPQDSDSVEGNTSEQRHYTCIVDGPDGTRLQVVGISAGWKDVYPAELPDQFVEISGVPDGSYVLEIELDPNDVFVEADETNNTVCTFITLAGSEAGILSPEVAC